MGVITFAIDEKTKERLARLNWVNWSEIARRGLLRKLKIEEIRNKTKTKEEKELIEWSVELGRKAKKGRFEKLSGKLPKTK
ncbi:hypothetical protein AUJ84_01600 [Candidatus Pacearchaeota archaeon CG1_02_32_132]|nr:MAG: hypothetical protein AUJ84_01600 [Candidatus Pacearchaeota archaeon CG1_02_32_132]